LNSFISSPNSLLPSWQIGPVNASESITPEQLMWHCSIYEGNIYYLKTLLHDVKLQAFAVWLLEWYVQSFVLSLSFLLGNRHKELTAELPPHVAEVLRSVLEVSVTTTDTH
jgi:hypothetical protein